MKITTTKLCLTANPLTKGPENPCSEAKTCGDCLAAGIDCTFCTAQIDVSTCAPRAMNLHLCLCKYMCTL